MLEHVTRTESTREPAPLAFYSVTQVARMFGMSKMTLYRAIAAGEFPAVQVRNRLIVPARAIEAMVDAAVEERTVVNAADWVSDDVRHLVAKYASASTPSGGGAR